MSSKETLQTAQSELAKAEEFERQAQKIMETAQQQANGFREQAGMHRSEYTRLQSQAQVEQQQEAEERERQAREDQKKKDDRFKAALG